MMGSVLALLCLLVAFWKYDHHDDRAVWLLLAIAAIGMLVQVAEELRKIRRGKE